MKTKFKETFSGVQKGVVVALSLVGAPTCHNKNEDDQSLIDRKISSSISTGGEIDRTLLIGEWEPGKFAYTADVNKISDEETISLNDIVLISDE